MKCSGTHCPRPASLLPASPHEQERLRAMEKWWGSGAGHRTPGRGLPGPRLPAVPPCCLHRTLGEFISSCLEYIYCLNHNYLARQSTLLSDVLSGGHFFSSNVNSDGLLLSISHLFLFLPAVPSISSCFFLPPKCYPPSSCFLPPQCTSGGERLNL